MIRHLGVCVFVFIKVELLLFPPLHSILNSGFPVSHYSKHCHLCSAGRNDSGFLEQGSFIETFLK